MRLGTENRKKTIAAGVLGVLALIALGYLYTSLYGGSPTPPAQPPVISQAPISLGGRPASTTAGSSATGVVTGSNARAGLGAAPGVPAVRLASASSNLDPTLDQAAMLRTESLVYSGAGRNIFAGAGAAPAPRLPSNVPPARVRRTPAAPVVTMPVGPPPPPPINLKFFGTERHRDGRLQAFFLQADDVYLAGEGDIIARKYRVQSLGPMSARVEDLQTGNVQTLPLQQ